MDINNIKYCKICGKMFRYKVSSVCPECILQMDNDLIICRDYLDKHPKCGIKQLAEGTGVTEKSILYLLKEGRIVLEGVAAFNCRTCGRPIEKGQYCERCLGSMKSDLNSAKTYMTEREEQTKQKTKQPESLNSLDKMYIANRIKEKK